MPTHLHLSDVEGFAVSHNSAAVVLHVRTTSGTVLLSLEPQAHRDLLHVLRHLQTAVQDGAQRVHAEAVARARLAYRLHGDPDEDHGPAAPVDEDDVAHAAACEQD